MHSCLYKAASSAACLHERCQQHYHTLVQQHLQTAYKMCSGPKLLHFCKCVYVRIAPCNTDVMTGRQACMPASVTFDWALNLQPVLEHCFRSCCYKATAGHHMKDSRRCSRLRSLARGPGRTPRGCLSSAGPPGTAGPFAWPDQGLCHL